MNDIKNILLKIHISCENPKLYTCVQSTELPKHL